MKAVRMYAPRDLRVEEVDVPGYEADECLIKVMAVGVCGSDIPRVNQYGAHVSPIIVGHEFGGVITEVGANVTKFKVGDKVTCPPLIPCFKCKYCQMGQYSLCEDYDYYGSRRDGAFAQYIAVKEGNLLKVDDKVSYEDAATTDPCANALHGMERAEFKPGDSVCVYGAGPIGLFAIQYAKIKGASKIIAVDVWEEKLEMAKKNGADIVVNSKNQDPVQAVMDATDGFGADVVIDFSGAPVCQKASILSAAKLGRVVFLGISHQGLELSEKEVDQLMRRQISLKGSWNSFTKPFPGSDWTGAVELYEKHGMTAKDIISHRLSLDEAPEMFEKIAKGGIFFSKIMFYPNGQEEK
ncbi:MAG: galactitol-1-phosphate 5-dehydrogenase [Lachnospiraceae bacterium]|nr:galactitol-1-phosphate 5-dehydrogenase [Lachnospiraceae bacterium]